jgi:hypothetical protein
MAYNGNFELALASIKAQKIKRYKATADKYVVEPTALRLYSQGKRTTRAEAAAIHNKLLSNVQEKAILGHIETLTLKGLPPTKEILENLIVELLHRPIGVNWVTRFIVRYSDEISSPYLRAIDNSRRIADNTKNFEQYYTRVCIIRVIICIYN